MESPLDVLTRAATMIEANQVGHLNGDLKRSLDLNAHSTELPSKMLKYKRMKERQQMMAAEAAEVDVDKRSAGTQTYSTFERRPLSPDPQRPQSEPTSSYRILDLDTRHTMSSRGMPPSLGAGAAPSPLPHHLSAPQRVPSPAHMAPRSCGSPARDVESMDTDAHPLNLSVTSSNQHSSSPPPSRHHVASVNSSPAQLRPSVITIAPTTTLTNHNNNRVGSGYSGYPHYSLLSQPAHASDIRTSHLGSPHHRREAQQQDDMCDPAIEEHFRRSLGAHYPNFMTKDVAAHHGAEPCAPAHRGASPPLPPPPQPKSSSVSPARVASSSVSPSSLSPLSGHWSSPSPPPHPSAAQPIAAAAAATSRADSEKAVSVTGTVDDHFARALGGDTWNQIKSQKEAVNKDIYTGSVDDHFAKALGDTWYKIKAEKEGSRSPDGSSRSNSSSPVSRPRSSSKSPSFQSSGFHS